MDIPPYPDRRDLLLSDKALFDRLFAHLHPLMSELTFAGLYLFRHAHRYGVSRVGESVVVTGEAYGGGRPYFLPPLGEDAAAAAEELLRRGLPLYCDDAFLRLLRKNVAAVEDRDAADYVYLRRELAELPGNRFRRKRNRIAYFEKRHRYRIDFFAAEKVEGCLRLLEKWERLHQEEEEPSLHEEAQACREGLTLAPELGLTGIVVEVEGEVKAFLLGERLNDDTVVCHFEKADLFLEGVYQLVNREFSARLFTGCTYVNREQDLGEPTLREAKLSYRPVDILRKYRVTLP